MHHARIGGRDVRSWSRADLVVNGDIIPSLHQVIRGCKPLSNCSKLHDGTNRQHCTSTFKGVTNGSPYTTKELPARTPRKKIQVESSSGRHKQRLSHPPHPNESRSARTNESRLGQPTTSALGAPLDDMGSSKQPLPCSCGIRAQWHKPNTWQHAQSRAAWHGIEMRLSQDHGVLYRSLLDRFPLNCVREANL